MGVGIKNEIDWESAKNLFEEVTGDKKPDPKFLQHRTGISKRLKTLDAMTVTPSFKLDIKKFEKELKSLSKDASDYIKVLDKKIEKEQVKDDKTRKRALKALKAKLESYELSYESHLDGAKGAQANLSFLEQYQRRLGKGLKVGVANCGAALKTIKSSPTPATYNKEMQDGARSLTTALKGFEQLADMMKKKDPEFVLSDVSKFWVDQAKSHVTDLSAYADGRSSDGDKTKVQDTVGKDEILNEIKQVGGIVKAVANDFSRVLA